ncbi:MAG: hypothetical protein IIB54_15255 [Planctomycetes bacterium]|nr:hypothetical protein [Planctomycetota bacterium]
MKIAIRPPALYVCARMIHDEVTATNEKQQTVQRDLHGPGGVRLKGDGRGAGRVQPGGCGHAPL